MKKITALIAITFSLLSCVLCAAEADPNSYADAFPTIPKNARIALLPMAYDFAAVPQEVPVIQASIVDQIKMLGFTPVNVKLDPASTQKEISQLFMLVNVAHKDVRPAKQAFLQNLKSQTTFDIALIPAVVSRAAKLSGQMAIWDNVKNSLTVKGFGSGASVGWSGSQMGLSLEIDAYDASGNWLFTSYGGISIPYIINTRDSTNDLKPRLFESEKDQGYLQKGVEVALKPLTKKVKVSKELVAAVSASAATTEVNLNLEPTDAEAQLRTAVGYYRGDGVEQDYKKAIHWFTKSAEQGNLIAQTTLGYIYFKGDGVPQDHTKAIQWYTKAAEQGSVDAQRNLGILYFNPEGVARDYKQALLWFTKAVEQGDLSSHFNLGLMYERGNGVAKDYNRAVALYSKAANQGYPNAQFGLGRMYGQGTGVSQDNKQAYIWFSLAATNGMNARNRDLAASRLTPQVLEQAQKETKVLFDKIEANKPKKQ